VETWASKIAYVVGPRTAGLLDGSGMQLRGAECGSASSLAQKIITENPSTPLLYLHGNLSRETLPRELEAAGIQVVGREVYRTTLRPELNLAGLPAPDWVVFFSPSGVQTVRPAWPRGWSQTRLAAIGPVTAEAIQREGWRAAAVAIRPAEDALLAAISQASNRTG
jgi:uroporphyrinogen-III synthase